MIRVQRLDHVAIPVSDAELSRDWYQSLFGLTEVFRDEWHGDPVFLQAGDTYLALLPTPLTEQPTYPGHFAFRVDRSSFDEARDALDTLGIAHAFEDHGVSWGLYMRDPDGHTVELACYEV